MKKKKYPNLPKSIVRKNRFFYVDSRTNQYIHIDNLAKYCVDDSVKENNKQVNK